MAEAPGPEREKWDELASEISEIVRDNLRIEPRSHDENLFDAGMDSLLLVDLLLSLEQKFEISIPFEELHIEVFSSVHSMTGFVLSRTAK